jgi:hypothetical protein
MIKRIVILILVLISLRSGAQPNPDAQKYAELITRDDLKDHLTIIASDALEGRETGKRGQKMAAALIANHFQELGLTGPVNGSYYQPVPLYSSGVPQVVLKAGNTEISPADYVYTGFASTQGFLNESVIFVGKGSEEEIKKVSVDGKSVLYLVEGRLQPRDPVVSLIRDKGVKIIFIVLENKDDFTRLATISRNIAGRRLSLTPPGQSQSTDVGTFYMTASSAEKILNTTFDKLKKVITDKKVEKVKPGAVSYSITRTHRQVSTENVLGYLEGTDKKDELIVITAHYDHIGVSTRAEGDRINNGADDDGSGTVAVMALAKAFAQAKKEGKGPRRSILFMTVTAEEIGLLGSQYYTDNPVFPLANTVVNLNIDMIGRRDPPHKDSPPYVYVIGSDKLSSELHALSESTNKTYTNLVFDYTYNDPDHPDRLYYRSDHWNFAKKDIPIIFYFDGIHEDYHRPSDEVDKIEFDLLTQRTKTVFHTAWEIANREGRLVVDKK